MFLELKDVHFSYMKGTKLEKPVLKGINLAIKEAEVVGLIGPTGSGKSTLIQHFNGLLSPDRGKVYVEGKAVGETIAPRMIRKKIGLVFQVPERQIFEESVFDEVAFGAKNTGCHPEELPERVAHALSMVGLDFNRLKDRMPLALSGGEMRRVAIASVLAMKPRALVLDEPTTGLDARGKGEIHKTIKYLREQENITVVIVSHDINEVASVSERIIVIDGGKIVLDNATEKVILEAEELEKIGLGIPQITALAIRLSQKGFNLPLAVHDVETAKIELLRHFHRLGYG